MFQGTHIGANSRPQTEQTLPAVPTIRWSLLAQALTGDTKPTGSRRQRRRGLLAASRSRRFLHAPRSLAAVANLPHDATPLCGDLYVARVSAMARSTGVAVASRVLAILLLSTMNGSSN